MSEEPCWWCMGLGLYADGDGCPECGRGYRLPYVNESGPLVEESDDERSA